MNEMVERVARGISMADGQPSGDWHNYTQEASAAIEASNGAWWRAVISAALAPEMGAKKGAVK